MIQTKIEKSDNDQAGKDAHVWEDDQGVLQGTKPALFMAEALEIWTTYALNIYPAW